MRFCPTHLGKHPDQNEAKQDLLSLIEEKQLVAEMGLFVLGCFCCLGFGKAAG